MPSTIVTSGCEPLFAAFTAAGLNAKQLLQDAGAIVQNDGVSLTNEEINRWADNETKHLVEQHRKQRQLIIDTAAALKAM